MTGAQIYLVGGAVRDELLGLPVRERDWVVVGADPDYLLSRGYRQVGADFPVFLHPQNGDEYALARRERKSGHGYHGFAVDFAPDVSLAEDLERRDLTVNAIARDADGNLVDPCGGLADLENRWLRHVSPAFAEDPLRVLRAARFHARLGPLGFRVADETLALMREMTASGELDTLTPERVWLEIRKALETERPSLFIRSLKACGALRVILPEVDALFGVPQRAEYHPEIDTGDHLCLALDMAARLNAPTESRFGVLLHDLGKGITPADVLPSHRGHERAGLPLVAAVCRRYRVPKPYRRLAERVCEHHLRCHRILQARPATVLKLLEQLDVFRRRAEFEWFLTACEADYRGRQGLADRPYRQADWLRAAANAARGVSREGLDGLDGEEIAELFHRRRLDAIGQERVQWAEQAAPGETADDESGD